MCREARDGACVGYAEEMRAETKGQLSADACEEVIDGAANTCKTCGAVIGGVSYCSACNVDDSGTASAPVDGQCTPENNKCPKKSAGVCTQGAHESFMFKGGCNATANAPGNTMCEAANAGICITAKQGYFVPPGADNAHQSVISCADETPVVLASNKQYKGVANCLKCTTPENGDGAETNAKAATCTECASGYFVDTGNGNICSACAKNCLTCADGTPDKCKSCTPETHFLGATSGQTGKCVSCGDASGETWNGVD